MVVLLIEKRKIEGGVSWEIRVLYIKFEVFVRYRRGNVK